MAQKSSLLSPNFKMTLKCLPFSLGSCLSVQLTLQAPRRTREKTSGTQGIDLQAAYKRLHSYLVLPKGKTLVQGNQGSGIDFQYRFTDQD